MHTANSTAATHKKFTLFLGFFLITGLACTSLNGCQSSAEKEGGTIGDTVWLDADADGVRDTEEVGMEGVIVRLIDAAGAVIATQTTRSNGTYQFDEVAAGTYTLEFDEPPGFELTFQDRGDDDAVDSDADPVSKRTSPITLSEGQFDRSWDAGLVPMLVETQPPDEPEPAEPLETEEVVETEPPEMATGENSVTGRFSNGEGDCMPNPADFQVGLIVRILPGNMVEIEQRGVHLNEGKADPKTREADVSTGKGDGTEQYVVVIDPELSFSGLYFYRFGGGVCSWDVEAD